MAVARVVKMSSPLERRNERARRDLPTAGEARRPAEGIAAADAEQVRKQATRHATERGGRAVVDVVDVVVDDVDAIVD